MSRGTRNLIILGCVIIIFAITNTVFSLAIYHNSGDIYLDRSRPGFLPDESESPSTPGDDYKFSESGKLTESIIKELVEHYQTELDKLDAYPHAFDASKLSDLSLGISAE